MTADLLAPDPAAEPEGFLVEVAPSVRLHFLDWGLPSRPAATGSALAIVLVHGLGQTAWSWAPVARRLCRRWRVIAPDVRGHGLSDAPPDGYEAGRLADDVISLAEAAGRLGRDDSRIVLAGHGFGACICAWVGARLGPACSGLVLVDGGLEDVGKTSGLEVDQLERELAEPPEVLRSMAAFLADRRAFDPSTWDADQERAARSTVVETPAGHLVPATRPQVLRACLQAMLEYDPLAALLPIAGRVEALVVGDSAIDDGLLDRVAVHRLEAPGHNLMRYRPKDVAGAIADVAQT